MSRAKIIFVIGMHRCGTSVLCNCIEEHDFSIGISKNHHKDIQNPKGYFENEKLAEFHNELLNFNKSSWKSINTNKMKYTNDHVIKYKQLLQDEFKNDLNILIKDPRLTFFTDFLKEVCKDDYDIYFIFITRNVKECCKSLAKAQNITFKTAVDIYDKTHCQFKNEFLKINHKDIILNNEETINKIAEYCNFQVNKNTNYLIDMKLYRERY